MNDIRLIATDMDGTLLNDAKQLPDGFFDLVQTLHKMGVHFVAGSGRSFPAQESLFAPVLGQMDFICDNGAFVMQNGAVTSVSALPHEIVAKAEALIATLGDGVCPVLCGAKGAYLPKGSFARYAKALRTYYAYAQEYTNFADVQDDILKVALYSEQPAGETTVPLLNEHYGADYNVVHSGANWVDMMCKGVNKGNGLRQIQASLGVPPEQTMVFGDFFNDVEMLACAKYSFVMENALPEMRAFANFVAPSNNENGVAKTIERYVLGCDPLPQK